MVIFYIPILSAAFLPLPPHSYYPLYLSNTKLTLGGNIYKYICITPDQCKLLTLSDYNSM